MTVPTNPHDDDIPPLLPPDQMPPITDQATLHRTWRALMGELGFARPQLWVLFLDGQCQPLHVVKLDEVPVRLDAGHAARVVAMLVDVDPRASFAFLYARPGAGPRTADDLSWANGLARACRDAGVRVWPVHLADDRQIRVVGPDDLEAAG